MNAKGQWYEIKPELALHIRARKARTVREYLRYFASKTVLRPLAILTDAFCHAVVVHHASDLVLMFASDDPAMSAAEAEELALCEHPEADAVVTIHRGCNAATVNVRIYTPGEAWAGRRHLPGAPS